MPVLSARTLGEVIGERGDAHRIEVEEWGCDVLYVPLTALLVTQFSALAADDEAGDHAWLELVPEILKQCVVDEDGARVFTRRRVEQLLQHRKHAPACIKVVNAIIAASGMDDEPDEDGVTDAEKN